MLQGVSFVSFYKATCTHKNIERSHIVTPLEYLEYVYAYRTKHGNDPRRGVQVDPKTGADILKGDSLEEAMNFCFDFKEKYDYRPDLEVYFKFVPLRKQTKSE